MLNHPLEGITVLDFSFFLAGPISGRLLADLGARVIKVEEVTGDPRRGYAGVFMSVQRGKEDIALDLKAPEGREIVYKLVRRADVVIHNMRVGAAERLGIGYEDLRAINPQLVYCHSSGFGSRGPRAKDPAMEFLQSAMAGILHVSAGEGNTPLLPLTSMDHTAGMNGALAVVLALCERERSGQGQYVECPQNGVAVLCSSDVHFRNGKKSRYLDMDPLQTGHGPLNSLYETADGWLCISCRPRKEWERLCVALGLADLRSDPRFSTHQGRCDNAEALWGILRERFLQKSAVEWIAVLEQHGVPCELSVPYPPERFTDDPTHLATGLMAEYAHPRFGRVRELGVPIGFSETPGRNHAPAPLLGQHTRQVLQELGYNAREIEALRARRVIAWEEA